MPKRSLRRTAILIAILAALIIAFACVIGRPIGGLNPAALLSGGASREPLNEPATIRVIQCISDDMKYDNDKQTPMDNVYLRQFEAQFGIRFQTLWYAPSRDGACGTKLLLSAATGGDQLPDIVNAQGDVLNKLIDTGKFMAVGELFEQYASSHMKAIVQRYPELWDPVTRPEGRMAIPVPAWAPNSPAVMYIRQDWLNKLGLKAPATIAEMERVLQAFTYRDPDGNHVDDTTGLAVAFKGHFLDTTADTSWIFGSFGVVPGLWQQKETGSALSYSSLDPRIKEGLLKLKEWISAGYIKKEAASLDGLQAAELFAQGKTGIIFGPPQLAAWPLQELRKTIPMASVAPYPLPSGAHDAVQRRALPIFRSGLLVNKQFKHFEALFDYIDRMLQWDTRGPLPGLSTRELRDSGIFMTQDDVRKFGLLPELWVDPYRKSDDALQYWAKQRQKSPLQSNDDYANCLKNAGCILQHDSIVVAQRQAGANRIDLFQGPPTKTMTSNMDYLWSLEYDTFIGIIFGSTPVDAFDAFVSDWKIRGGNEITREVNQWYSKKDEASRAHRE